MRATERKAVRKFIFNIGKSKPIDDQIDAILDEMQSVGVTSEEYPKLMKLLDQLTEIKKKVKRDRFSRDTLLIVAGNILGILIIVVSEREHVMTSRGFSHIIRPR